MEMVNVLHSSVCSSAYFSCPLWRLHLKSAERAHSQADYIETCAVRLNGG